MKKSLLAVVLAAFTVGALAAEPAKKEATPAVQNDNCVKKDKNGKCPELPKSPKPTPKKKAEAK